MIGQAVGAAKHEQASHAIGNTVTLFMALSVILTVGLLLAVKPIVNVMSTPAEAVPGTVSYLTICFIGIPFITAYNIISSIFRGMGDASKHDMLSFLHTFFAMKSYLPEFHIEKLLLDSAHDAYPLYEYCKTNGIAPFIDLNPGHTGYFKYKDDFTIGEDGVPVCKLGLHMHHNSVEKAKHREKYRCPLANRKKGCFCEHPCSESKYGRTVHIQQKDNPRLFNIPSRDSKEWKLEYNKRTSVEQSNKREKIDYKLEDDRHRSSKMWYYRLYAIMILQHLDAWKMPTRVDTIFTFSQMATSK